MPEYSKKTMGSIPPGGTFWEEPVSKKTMEGFGEIVTAPDVLEAAQTIPALPPVEDCHQGPVAPGQRVQPRSAKDLLDSHVMLFLEVEQQKKDLDPWAKEIISSCKDFLSGLSPEKKTAVLDLCELVMLCRPGNPLFVESLERFGYSEFGLLVPVFAACRSDFSLLPLFKAAIMSGSDFDAFRVAGLMAPDPDSISSLFQTIKRSPELMAISSCPGLYPSAVEMKSAANETLRLLEPREETHSRLEGIIATVADEICPGLKGKGRLAEALRARLRR